MLTSFVLSGAPRDRRMRRPAPPTTTRLDGLLFGISVSASVLLTGHAGWQAVTG